MEKTGSLSVSLLILLMVSLCSCATVISGTKQRIPIVTVPAGAEVWVGDELRDTTPCVVKIKRTWEEPEHLRITKTGYREENIALQKKMNEIVILNFINVFGWALDGATAACIRYHIPDTILLAPRKKSP